MLLAMRIRRMIVALGAAVALLGPAPAAAQIFSTSAPYAFLLDFDSGTVLFEKAAEERFAPASMVKMMTAEYLFYELQEGRLAETDEFVVSEDAWRRGGAPSGGSAMFAEVNSSIPVRDLMRGLIVQSGNDAAIALAEGVAGSEAAFADLMNRRAAALGLADSRFQNASGLHDPEQVVTARDLAMLARHIIETYPEYYPIFAEPEFTWNGITQRNRNPLIQAGIGVDGLKTGFIRESGYGITVSAMRNDQRLVLVVAGLDSEAEREAEARKLLDWGYRNFVRITAFEAGETIAEAAVYGGEAGRVALRAEGPVEILVGRSSTDLRGQVVYQGPLMAPIEPDMAAGKLLIYEGDRLVHETPLFTAESVARGGLRARALDALGELLFGWL
jgi:D-alanyl-D-alanine carboxypeptidase (penicillin-binding protein 5/6)